MKNLFRVKYINVILLLSFSLWYRVDAIADPSSEIMSSNLKIAVIKSNSLENCLYFKSLKAKWEKEFNPRGEQLQSKQKEFENKKEFFQRDRAILSDKERINKERELTKLQQDLQYMYENLDTEVKARQQDDLINFNKFVDQVVSNFAKKEKYDLILNEQGFLYSSDTLDCTEKLLLELDNQFKSKKK